MTLKCTLRIRLVLPEILKNNLRKNTFPLSIISDKTGNWNFRKFLDLSKISILTIYSWLLYAVTYFDLCASSVSVRRVKYMKYNSK